MQYFYSGFLEGMEANRLLLGKPCLSWDFFPVGAYIGNMRKEGKTISSNLSGDSAANVFCINRSPPKLS